MGVTQDFQERIGRIDGLVKKLEAAADPALRRAVRELVESLMEIHGAGLDRILEIASNQGEAGASLVQSLAKDELVSSLLVLYGLHPEDFETRVRRGLDNIRPLLRSHGVRIDLVDISDSTVRLKIIGEGFDSQEAVRNALLETAPDAADVVIEGGKTASRNGGGFVPLTAIASATQP